MKIWLANIAPEVDDAGLKDFLLKYGFPEPAAIDRVPGDGTRPGAFVTFEGVDSMRLANLTLRIDGIFWNGRKLVAQASSPFSPT